MITERTLRKWRGEALVSRESGDLPHNDYHAKFNSVALSITYSDRILRLTQELLDQHLLRKEMK